MSTLLTGILLCHGHSFTREFPNILPRNVNWIQVDLDPTAEPDIIADVANIKDLVNKLGKNRYDYVVDYHCPSTRALNRTLKNAGVLLKDNGKFILLKGVTHLLLLMTMITGTDLHVIMEDYMNREEGIIGYIEHMLGTMSEEAGYKSWFIPNDENNQPGKHVIFTK